jgi:hypothetical protein
LGRRIKTASDKSHKTVVSNIHVQGDRITANQPRFLSKCQALHANLNLDSSVLAKSVIVFSSCHACQHPCRSRFGARKALIGYSSKQTNNSRMPLVLIPRRTINRWVGYILWYSALRELVASWSRFGQVHITLI